MHVLAFSVILDSVEEPSRNSVSFGVVVYAGNGIALFFGELACSESGVDSQDFADEESVSSTDTLYSLKGKRNCPLTIDVGVEDTVDVLEVILSVFDDQ